MFHMFQIYLIFHMFQMFYMFQIIQMFQMTELSQMFFKKFTNDVQLLLLFQFHLLSKLEP